MREIFDRGYGMLAAMRRREETATAGDAALVARARAGDREAFRELLETHLPRVWRVVWRLLRHREDTEDVVQEVFLAAHRALPDYRGEARFSTWLHRIAVNRALNHRELAAERLRRASRSLEGPAEEAEGGEVLAFPPLAADGPSPLQELEGKELRRRLADCLKKLPAAWRAALTLRDGESLPYEEIARALGIALGTVRSRLARARMSLKSCIEGEGA